MGMFDDIRCDMPLPSDPSPPSNRNFQTKFAEWPQMDKYVITAAGMLLVDREQQTDVIEFHGDFEFHQFDDKTSEWWSYIARFTEGRCVRIWCDDYHIVEVDTRHLQTSATKGE